MDATLNTLKLVSTGLYYTGSQIHSPWYEHRLVPSTAATTHFTKHRNTCRQVLALCVTKPEAQASANNRNRHTVTAGRWRYESKSLEMYLFCGSDDFPWNATTNYGKNANVAAANVWEKTWTVTAWQPRDWFPQHNKADSTSPGHPHSAAAK